MKKIFFILLIQLFIFGVYAQTEKPKIYNPNADAKADIAEAISKAKAENKHVLLQIGGNWCSWCLKLHKFFNEQTKADSILKADYIFVLVNYSKENQNLPILSELEFPQRFGFPVMVILDTNGKRIHTQDTGLLESGNGYDLKKVLGFLEGWSPKAISPNSYNKK